METDKYFIVHKDNKIFYTLVKSRRKTIGIRIEKNGEVRVSAPIKLGRKHIEDVIREKAGWIIKKVDEVKKKNSNIVQREYVNGEKLLYLGKEYTLEVVERSSNRAEVRMQDDKIIVYITHGLLGEQRKQTIKKILEKWYRKRFSEIVNEKTEQYSVKLNVTPRKVFIKDQKTRWGSCSVKGNVNFNWRLVMAPVEIIDYVVIHELCHLKVMNHSKTFWALVESMLPSFKDNRRWLKNSGHRLVL